MRFLLASLFALVCVSAQGQGGVWVELEDTLRGLAGSNAIDCGSVGIHENPTKASACALDAFRQRKPFYVVYRMQGIDSAVGRAVAGNAAGEVYVAEFDSFGTNWHSTTEETVTPNHHILYGRCKAPVELIESRTGRLNCAGVPEELNSDPGVCPVEPRYTPPPPSLWGHPGSLEAELIVGADGSVEKLSVTQSDFSPETTDAILASVREWRFEPGVKNGIRGRLRLKARLVSERASQTVLFPELSTMSTCPCASQTRVHC